MENEVREFTPAEAYEEIKRDILEMEEVKRSKQFMRDENLKLKERVEELKSEIAGIDVVIASTQNDMEYNEFMEKELNVKISTLKEEKDRHIDEVNNLQFSIKALKDDFDNCNAMRDHLAVEHESILMEKDILLKKIRQMEEGIANISGKNTHKLPYLRGVDAVLKRLNSVFKEAESRIDVSMKLMQ